MDLFTQKPGREPIQTYSYIEKESGEINHDSDFPLRGAMRWKILLATRFSQFIVGWLRAMESLGDVESGARDD